MSEVGRPSELNDELFLKIRGLVLDGKNMKEVAEILEIPYKTMEGWVYRNYEGFADKMLAYKHEKLIQKAETNLDLLLDGEDDKIKADLSKFVLETLAKQNYSKKTETDVTSGGKPIFIPSEIADKNNIQTNETSLS